MDMGLDGQKCHSLHMMRPEIELVVVFGGLDECKLVPKLVPWEENNEWMWLCSRAGWGLKKIKTCNTIFTASYEIKKTQKYINNFCPKTFWEHFFKNISITCQCFIVLLTVANFSMSSSEAPSEARPISWENWAKVLSANIGTWPSSSCTQSLLNQTMLYLVKTFIQV